MKVWPAGLGTSDPCTSLALATKHNTSPLRPKPGQRFLSHLAKGLTSINQSTEPVLCTNMWAPRHCCPPSHPLPQQPGQQLLLSPKAISAKAHFYPPYPAISSGLALPGILAQPVDHLKAFMFHTLATAALGHQMPLRETVDSPASLLQYSRQHQLLPPPHFGGTLCCCQGVLGHTQAFLSSTPREP